ncbi:MAG: hypothetical protein HY673_12895 [Chloroflexi bacterium]|nr:hypothetical protein [Chloroflexota bacterium]
MMREKRQKVQDELLKKCLRMLIAVLEEQILQRATKGDFEEAKIQLEGCRRPFIDPSQATEGKRYFLFTEY